MSASPTEPAPADPIPEAPATPDATPPTAPARRRSLARRLVGPFLLLFCLGSGVAGGTVGRKYLKPSAEQAKHDEHAPARPHQEPVVDHTHQSAVAQIDTWIRAGSFGDALALCKTAPRTGAADERALAYRQAACLEALGRLKEATDAYKRAEPGEGDQAAWARAVLGQARCAAAAGDLPTAQVLLDRVALRSGHPDCAGTHISEECIFLRARFDALRLGSVRALDPFDPEAVAWPALAGSPDKYHEWLPPDTTPPGSTGPAMPNTVDVRRAATGFDVTAHLAERPVPELLRAIANSANLKLQIEANASAALAKEVTALDVEAMPLAELLVALTGRHGVGCKLDADALTVSLVPQAAPARATVAQSFRRVIAVAPGHPSANAVRVWVGNFNFQETKWREAAAEYQQVLEVSPEVPETLPAYYNMGLTELRTGELNTARTRFVNLIDRGAKTKWVDYAWWWVGRSHLDTGDTASAKKAFQSALRGRTREVTSAAAMGACACELLDGNEEAARKVFTEVRIDSRDDHAALANCLDTFFRYRTKPSESRRELFLAAMRGAGDCRGLGPCGVYLAGRVYRELGMPERTAALYDAATESIRGPLAIRMTFDTASWYELIEKVEPARARYLAVAAADPKGLGPKAELRLAEMSCRERNTGDCLRRCRSLLNAKSVDKAEVLAVMGRAYELQRNYRLAADCFAGRVPVE